jgi:hypothetical protein
MHLDETKYFKIPQNIRKRSSAKKVAHGITNTSRPTYSTAGAELISLILK